MDFAKLPTADFKTICLAIASGAAILTTASAIYYRTLFRRKRKAFEDALDLTDETKLIHIANGVIGLIGNTPLIKIKSLSEETGVEILGKAEFLNPGGSSKDRVALSIITAAEHSGIIKPNTNCTIYEGTVGSTGIALAMICRAKGYNCHIVMPDDVAIDKVNMLERLGAFVERVKPASIIDKNQFVNAAKRRSEEYTDFWKRKKNNQSVDSENGKVSMKNENWGKEETNVENVGNEWLPKGYFADQFENLANFQAHYETTGPEIYRQAGGMIDAFVMGAGTGGTLAGVTRYLKPRIPGLKVVLADPPGSGLYNKVKYNVFYSAKEAEGTRRRHQVDTIIEGIGINRLTANFALVAPYSTLSTSGHSMPWIDDAITVTDAEAVEMSRYIMRTEGLFLGSSSAVNLVVAVKVARKLKKEREERKKWGQKVENVIKKTAEKAMVAGRDMNMELGERIRVVTVLCDSGMRHLSKFWNDEFINSVGLMPNAKGLEFIKSN